MILFHPRLTYLSCDSTQLPTATGIRAERTKEQQGSFGNMDIYSLSRDGLRYKDPSSVEPGGWVACVWWKLILTRLNCKVTRHNFILSTTGKWREGNRSVWEKGGFHNLGQGKRPKGKVINVTWNTNGQCISQVLNKIALQFWATARETYK